MPAKKAVIQTADKKTYPHATIEQIKTVYRALPLTAYQTEYIRGSAGIKSTARSAVVLEAVSLRNITSRALAFFCALCKMGFSGTLSPLDVLSERLISSTGGKGATRTLRRALKDLEVGGWIYRHKMPTNTRIKTPKGWITLSILKIDFTDKLLTLLGYSDVSHIYIHRPKRPLLLETQTQKAKSSIRSLPSVVVTINDTEKKESHLDAEEQLADARTSNLTESQNHSKEGESQKLCQKETTTDELKGAFLSAVEAQLFAERFPEAEKLAQIAENQNDKRYPAAFPRIPFDVIVWSLASWTDKRRLVNRYCQDLVDFGKKNDLHSAAVKKIFLFFSNRVKISFSEHIGSLVVIGKMRIKDVPGNILQDFPS